MPGLAFFTLSLISTQARRSFPVRVEQVIRSDAEKAASKAKAAAKLRAVLAQYANARPAEFVAKSNSAKSELQDQPKKAKRAKRRAAKNASDE